MDDQMSVSQVSDVLNINKESVRRLARQGEIEAQKICGVYFFNAEYIAKYATKYNPLPGRRYGRKKNKRGKKKNRKGYVYILLAENGLRKIGRTNNPKSRLGSFAMSPIEIDVEKIYAVADSLLTEKLLHEKFHSKRVRGEWFCLNESDLETMKELIRGTEFAVKRINKDDGLQLSLIDFFEQSVVE